MSGYDVYPKGGGGGGGQVIPPGTAVGQILQWDGASWVPGSEGTVVGQILTWDGSAWVPGASPAGWTTRYSVDFTTLASSGVLANGVRVIDGKNWTIENAANGTIQVINGTGLVISPQVACDLNNGFRSAPLLTARLIDLAADADWTLYAGIRMAIRYTTTNQNSDFKGAVMALARFGAAAGTDRRWEMARFWSGGLGWYPRFNISGATTAAATQTNSTGDDIMMLTLRDLNTAVHATDVNAAGTFPVDYGAAKLRGFSQTVSAVVSSPLPFVTADELCALLAASDFNGSVNYTFVIQELLLQSIG